MNKLIKFIPIIMMAASVTTGSAQSSGPASMSDADKAKLIEELKVLQDAGLSRKMKLIKAGITAITPASQNENEAMNLYEKCYKKINFDDNENKKDKDWREWRTSQKDNLNSNYNKKALRYQAKWALITLQAAMEPKETFDPSKYASQAIALMTEILQDTKLQTESTSPYNSSILNGPIGQVFELQGMRPDNWPDNIMEPTRVIESLVLQPSRDKGDTVALRNGWNRMIQMQKVRMETQMTAAAKNSSSTSNNGGRGGFGGPGGRGGMRGMNLTSKGIEDMVVGMSWQREMDCYRHGDESASALNMMTLIKGMKEPKRMESYVNQLIALLQGKEDDRRNNRRNNNDMAAGPGANRPGAPTAAGTPGAGRPTTSGTTGTARTTAGSDTSGTSSASSGTSAKTTTSSGTGSTTPARPATPPTPPPLPSTEGLFD